MGRHRLSEVPGSAPRSLLLQTLIDVLPADRVVVREGDHLIVRSPSNPHHWEGNMLVFDDAPAAGDGERWEAAFDAAFAGEPGVRHRTFYWDRTDGEEGAAASELQARGYRLERDVGLIASPDELTAHPRANHEVEIRRLDPAADDALWEGTIAVALANNAEDPSPDPDYELFLRSRQAERRAVFTAGRGAWYVALDPGDGSVVAGCGVIATGPRGRFQAVDTAPSHRRRGIARRLVYEAGRDAATRFALSRLVIVADGEYHALGIYESLGFRPRERVCSAWLSPAR
jgi:ribosomal protein S18 acetylase RimI-like enzyme